MHNVRTSHGGASERHVPGICVFGSQARRCRRSGVPSAVAWPLAVVFIGLNGCRPFSHAVPQPLDQAPSGALRESITANESFAHSAGQVLAGEPLRHVFRYCNDSPAPLRQAPEQAVRTTCGCTRVQLERTSLQPGESTELSIEIDTQNRLGEISESATVTWLTDEDEPRHCQFTLTGEVVSAFALDPPELTFTREDLRSAKRKLVHCRTDVPIDWERLELHADEPYIVVESLQRDQPSGRFSFEVACRPTHRGGHRQSVIRIRAAKDGASNGDPPCYHAQLPVFSHDFAPLRIAPLSPVFDRQADDQAGWSGYVILTGDVIEQGTRPKAISVDGCDVDFTIVPLSAAAQRVNITLHGPVESLTADQRELDLTLDNGLRQSLAFRLQFR